MVRAGGIKSLTTLAVVIVQVCVAAPVGLLAGVDSSPADLDARRAITAMDLVTLKDIGEQYAAGLAVSPSGDQLAAVDVSGHLSLWELPSFRLKRRWSPQELVSVIHRTLIMAHVTDVFHPFCSHK